MPRGLRARIRILCGALVIGFMAGQLVLSSAAHAVDCSSFNEEYANPATTWRGVKVSSPGMRVTDTSIGCTRISWIYVRNSAGTKIVNVGWYETEIHDFNCLSTSERPRVLRLKQVSGTATCDQNTHEYGTSETPTDDDFSVHDDNQDGIWEYRRNGVLVGSYDLGAFTSGSLGAGTARYSASGDSMYGNLDGLKRMGPGGTWNGWDNSTGSGTDPDYIACVHSSTWTEVKLGGCP